MISLTYGTLPSKKEFKEHTKDQYPYPMELVGDDADVITRAINIGIDSHLEIVNFEQFVGDYGKLGVRICDANSMYVLLRRLVEFGEKQEDFENDYYDLASCIMTTLEYEWI